MHPHLARPGKKSVALVAALGLVATAAVVIAIRASSDAGNTIAKGDGPALVTESGSYSVGTLGLVRAGQYRSAYFGDVCLSEPGTVTIRSIEPVEARGGLTVTDFAVLAGEDTSLGASGGRLRDEPAYRGGKSVTEACPSKENGTLIVEVHKPGAADAGAREFTITYDSDGDRRTAALRFGFGLCEKDTCDVV